MKRVEVAHLTKKYGSLKAVDDFSFSAGAGEIVSIVGPDGSGKTSAFRAICGLIRFDSGQIHIDGHDITRHFDLIKPHLGYMPQAFSLYPDLTVEENLYFYAGLFGLNRRQFEEKKPALYAFSALGPFHDRRAGALSGGMKQKLALSCALVHDPDVLILDEPTTGVDPVSRRQFWDILRKIRGDGSCIVVSTPYMDEVALSDQTIFVHQGQKMAEGKPGELVRLFSGRVYQVAVHPTFEKMEQLRGMSGLVARRFGSSLHLYTTEEHPIESFYGELQMIGIAPEAITSIQPGLEDTFIQYMER